MNNIVTIQEFQSYANYYEENMESMVQTYLDSAESIVESFLGYSPIATDYEEIIEGIGSDKLYTAIPHISEFSYVMDIEKEEILNNLVANEEYIYERDGKEVFKAGKKYKVSYVGGWSLNKIPADIKMCVLRIASVQLSEADGNIALTSRSTADNSRSFFNYTNYSKFTQQLLPYKSKRIC